MEAQPISPVKASDAFKQANAASGLGEVFQAMLRESVSSEEAQAPDRREAVARETGRSSPERGGSEPAAEREAPQSRRESAGRETRSDARSDERSDARPEDRGDREPEPAEAGPVETQTRREDSSDPGDTPSGAQPADRDAGGAPRAGPGKDKIDHPLQAQDDAGQAAETAPAEDGALLAAPGVSAFVAELATAKNAAKPPAQAAQGKAGALAQVQDMAAGARQTAAGDAKAGARVTPAAVVTAPQNALGGAAASLALAQAQATDPTSRPGVEPAQSDPANIESGAKTSPDGTKGQRQAPGPEAGATPAGLKWPAQSAAVARPQDIPPGPQSDRQGAPDTVAPKGVAPGPAARPASANAPVIIGADQAGQSGVVPAAGDPSTQAAGDRTIPAARTEAARTAGRVTAAALSTREQGQRTAATGAAPAPASPGEQAAPAAATQGASPAGETDMTAAAPAPRAATLPNSGAAAAPDGPANSAAAPGNAAPDAESLAAPGQNPGTNAFKTGAARTNDGTPIQAARSADGAGPQQAHLPAMDQTQAATRAASVQSLSTRIADGQGVPVDDVAVHIQRAAARGEDRIRIRLHPAELGQVEVKLKLGADGAVRAVISVDRPETFDLMQRDSRGLERALQDAGLKTDSGSLSFNLRGEGQGDAHGRKEGAHAGASTSEAPAAPDLPDDAPALARSASNRALDIRV